MILLVVFLILILSFALFTKIDENNIKRKEKEWKHEAELKRIEELTEMLRLKLDDRGYRLHKLKELVIEYMNNFEDAAKLPTTISFHYSLDKIKIFTTYTKEAGYRLWSKPDSELIFLLVASSKIVSFFPIDYENCLRRFKDGPYNKLCDPDFKTVIIDLIKSKTLTLSKVIEEKGIMEVQSIRGLLSSNFDKSTLKEIYTNSESISRQRRDLRKINWWYEGLEYNEGAEHSEGAANWVNRKEIEFIDYIESSNTEHETIGIYYLQDLICTQK